MRWAQWTIFSFVASYVTVADAERAIELRGEAACPSRDAVLAALREIDAELVVRRGALPVEVREDGQPVHVVAGEYTAGGTPLTGAGVAVSPSSSYAAGPGLASALGVTIDALAHNGVCIFTTSGGAFQPPWEPTVSSTISATGPAGLEVWAMTDGSTMPPTFAQQASSPDGVYGLYVPSLTSAQTVTITSTATSGSLTFPPGTCELVPGFVSLAGVSGS